MFAANGVVQWGNIVNKVLIPMVVSPVVGLVLGYVFMLAILWAFRKGHPAKLNRGFRVAQTVSAAAMSIGHGMQDAAKTMGIVVLALYTGGFQDDTKTIPWWVFWTSAAVLAAGTYAGGWRIIRTLGRKIIDLGPPEGFAAETVASAVLYFNALVLHAPISTTHTITSAIMGVGATKRLNAVRWNVAGTIIIGWVITFPAAAAIACMAYFAVRPLFN
jgi:PiT family inorganic phosphate transporter